VRSTLPDAGRDVLHELAALRGVDGVETRGESVIVQAKDSDAVARFLLTRTHARDLEITAHGLEEAFLSLTDDEGEGR
jgi:ABC-2 type transport system ATP-binding protein